MPAYDSLHQLIYYSRATSPLSEAVLTALLHKARLHNQGARLGGLLLYAEGQFLQVLEGFEPDLSELYARIQADPLHHDVRTLAYGPIRERAFPDWRMGYAVGDAATIEQATGFLPLPATPGLTAHPSEELAQQLKSFAAGRVRN
jgi:hypothetical protein